MKIDGHTVIKFTNTVVSSSRFRWGSNDCVTYVAAWLDFIEVSHPYAEYSYTTADEAAHELMSRGYGRIAGPMDDILPRASNRPPTPGDVVELIQNEHRACPARRSGLGIAIAPDAYLTVGHRITALPVGAHWSVNHA